MAFAYVELSSADEVWWTKEKYVRKFLYIYGGFSFDCSTACFDMWRYEIPYTPLAMPPPATWTNSGNHWVLMQ